MLKLSKGFTIVELLIVVVVIGILATISIVAYSGIQERAEYARAKSDLKHINDALQIYKSKEGSYPVSPSSAWEYQYAANSTTLNTNFMKATSGTLPSLIPSYLDTMPLGKANASFYRYSYQYISDGSNYKLLRCMIKLNTTPYNGLSGVEKSNELSDTSNSRTNACWGYWSAGAATW